MAHKVLVFGAINIDVSIKTQTAYVIGDSNPANISFSVGGVGANIAMNLATLGNTVEMVTTVGDNPFYQFATRELEYAGVSLAHAKQIPSLPSNFYMSILQEENDLFLGLNDMKGILSLDHSFLLDKHIHPNDYDAIVLDNNLAEDILHDLAKQYADKPLYIDTVSIHKAPKVLSILPYLSLLKCNHLEFQSLQSLGFEPRNYPDLITIVTHHEKPIRIFQNERVDQVVVTPVEHVVSTSGAGDALLSGIIDALLDGKQIIDAVLYGTTIATQVIGRQTSSLKGSFI